MKILDVSTYSEICSLLLAFSVISGEGIDMSRSHIQKIIDWPKPKHNYEPSQGLSDIIAHSLGMNNLCFFMNRWVHYKCLIFNYQHIILLHKSWRQAMQGHSNHSTKLDENLFWLFLFEVQFPCCLIHHLVVKRNVFAVDYN